MTSSFVTSVQSAFGFLEDDYGFVLAAAEEDQGRRFYGGYVSYSSPHAMVRVSIDRGILLSPDIARAKDRDQFVLQGKMSLDRIFEYMVTTPEERSRLASHDPEELKHAWKAVVESKRIDLEVELADDTAPDLDSRVRSEATAYGRLLRKYGEPFLRGDFSSWLELHEYHWNWLVASEIAHNMRWGEELTVENVEARFGKLRSYLEALRREFNQV